MRQFQINYDKTLGDTDCKDLMELYGLLRKYWVYLLRMFEILRPLLGKTNSFVKSLCWMDLSDDLAFGFQLRFHCASFNFHGNNRMTRHAHNNGTALEMVFRRETTFTEYFVRPSDKAVSSWSAYR